MTIPSASPPSKRANGSGSVFLRGNTWWIKYHRAGKPYRESAHTDSQAKAEKFLRFRLAQIAQAKFTEPKLQRVFVRDLLPPFLADLGNKDGKDVGRVVGRWQHHLAPVFADLRVVDLSGAALNQYVEDRRQAGASNATVNRELSILKRMLHLGFQADPQTVSRLVPFPALKEAPPRQGYLADAAYDKLARECAQEGLWLRGMLAIYFNYGWRRTEVVRLKVRQIDLAARTIRLDAGATKNDAARTVKMTEEVFTLLTACVVGKSGGDYVFTRPNGHPVRDFTKCWTRACQRAGVPDLRVHDLRRTGARNLRRLGLAESTIMKVGGWKTNAVFKRYDINDESDLVEAARRLDQKRQTLWAQSGHNEPEVDPGRVQ